MKVVHVIPSMAMRTGGPAFVVASLCTALAERGLQIELVTTDLGGPANARAFIRLDPVRDMPAIHEHVQIHIAPVRWVPKWALAPSLHGLLEQAVIDADLIHIHSVNLHTQHVAWRVARSRSIPYVVTPHGALDPYLRRRRPVRKRINDVLWQRRMLDSASAIHMTSDHEMRLIAGERISAPQVVVPLGIDFILYSRATSTGGFRDSYLGGFEGPLIFHHGRFSHKKGLDILISAIARLQPGGSDVRLAMIGPDDEGLTRRLRIHAAELGVDNLVKFVGELRGEALAAAVADADLWVLPSHTENFGLAVAEAMAAGKPVVTSPHVNIAPEAAAAGALVMVDNDPALIAAEIAALLRDPSRRARVGQRAREYVKRFDWNELGPRYIAMYNDAIEYHRRRGPYKRRVW